MSSVPDYRMRRNVDSIVGRGRVKYVNDSGVVQVIQVQMNGLETADNRYRVAEFGFTSNPPIDSDVIALHVAGERSAGAVIGTNHQSSRPTGLEAGESMIYSQDGKQVYLTADGGIIVEAKGQNVVVNDAENVTCNARGTLTVNAPTIVLNGNVQINGNIGQSGASGTMGTATFTAPITAPDINLPNGAVNGHNHYVPAAPGTSNQMAN
ncbi:phage baseplate assembly protein V [Paraburkholderia bannensis]|uniref:Phage baseplate assembly protein V n=1 Tax=Paraburkholderia bannensis TaxID=765414 RepID=A0A7W9TUV7_9BURK|nr:MULTISPECIES: phage baseplate assembly protein V [Paraburkholderia]MBB3256856.1 phage baseplate assembly protein V [Paraburkholderia sp. WP4_3_2]MBB6101853.1 phage baseplate assembly protein V [Paraburkholderia bannensis]